MVKRNLAAVLMGIGGLFAWMILDRNPFPLAGPAAADLILNTPIVTPLQGRIVLPSGQPLMSFFDGIKPNSEFTISKLLDAKGERDRRTPACGPSAKSSPFDHVLSFLRIRTVEAQGNPCTGPQTICAGSHWENQPTLTCTGQDCGTYTDVTWDAGFPELQGKRYTGVQGCQSGHEPECFRPCNQEKCDMTPPCDVCDETGPADCNNSEHRCTNGCCEAYTCPSGQKCDIAGV